MITFYTPFSRAVPSRLLEWKGVGAVSVLEDRTSFETVDVKGNFAIWSVHPDIALRDLTTDTTTTFGPGHQASLAPTGDVIWQDGPIRRRRASDGVTEQLAADGEYPITDGINSLWSFEGPPSDLAGVGPGNAPLADFSDIPYRPHPSAGYAVDGGWIAYARAAPPDNAHYSVWRRAPGGAEEEVTGDSDRETAFIYGLNSEGEVIYGEHPTRRVWFSSPGQAPVRTGGTSGPGADGETNRGLGDHVSSAGGLWYQVQGNVLRRLQEGDAPVPGSQTTIDDGPEGIVESSAGDDFAFSSTVAGATFECKLDAAEWAPCTSPVSYPSFADGLHTFMVRAVAPGGEVDPEPASQAWVVDTAGPTTQLEWPVNGSATDDTTPGVGGHAGTAYGDGPVTLEIWAGETVGAGAPLRTFARAPAPDGLWQVDGVDPPLPEGVYTARAKQTDVAGNTSQSTATFTVDTTQPEPITQLTPQDGAIVGPSPTFTWEATEDTGSGVDRYRLHVVTASGQRDWDTYDTTCSGGVCSASLPAPLAGGDYVWRAQAFDEADNVRTSAPRELVVDATPPDPFSLAAPADGARTADATPTLTWDAAGGAATYDVFLDGSRVASGLAGTEHTPDAPLADGPHAWRVEAIDTFGNTQSSATRTVVVDTTAPTAAIAPAPNPVLAGDAVVLDASGSTDAFSGPIVRYEWDAGGDGTFEADTGGTPSHGTTFTTGEHHPAVRVTDAVGHTATAAVDVSARPVPLPGFAGVSIDDGARYTNDPDVTVRVVWPPLASGVALSNDGGFVGAPTLPLSAEIPWTIDDTGSERLPRTIYARFTGLPGLRETYQDDIVLDQTAPQLMSA
ncbi:MAG: Ig-like domain-containing protein, partial [Actinomycetota bacterium]|nr:Ig-like domain-containing protein [Actinomycetota bacterium]